MKIILIIQTIVILVGAYVIYTRVYTQSDETTVPVLIPATTPSSSTTEPIIIDTSATATNAVEAPIIHGPNDAGMEWPTMQ